MITVPPFYPDHFPSALLPLPQFVAWRYEERDGKATKIPISVRTGRLALTNAPSTWATLDEALPFARRHDHGIGFVFAASDPYAGVDLDRCIADGRILPWAWEIVQALDSYTEVSPSGTGLKVYVRATLPPGRRGWGDGHGMYDRTRFFTLTGQRLAFCPATIEERQGQIDALHARVFPPAPAKPEKGGPTLIRSLDDTEIVRRAMSATNGHKFAQLWLNQGHGYASESEADAALCALLAFWTGPDSDRVDGLFRQSARMRPKWERASYRDKTIALALKGGTFYAPRPQARRDGIPLFSVRGA